jgi:hypothetical protein
METVPLFRPGEKLVCQQISTNVVLLWGTRLLAPSLRCWRARGNPGDLLANAVQTTCIIPEEFCSEQVLYSALAEGGANIWYHGTYPPTLLLSLIPTLVRHPKNDLDGVSQCCP